MEVKSYNKLNFLVYCKKLVLADALPTADQ